MLFSRKKLEIPTPAEALPGRSDPIPTAATHFVNGRKLSPPYPPGLERILFGMGCFWGAERKFWQAGEGVYVTAVGYAGGSTQNPTYEEVCSGMTGHTEAVQVVYDPAKNRTGAAAGPVLGIARPDPGHAARRRHRHAISFRDLYDERRPAEGGGKLERALPAGALRPWPRRDHHGNWSGGRNFTLPKAIISNILPRIRRGYCGLGGSGVACPVGVL